MLRRTNPRTHRLLHRALVVTAYAASAFGAAELIEAFVPAHLQQPLDLAIAVAIIVTVQTRCTGTVREDTAGNGMLLHSIDLRLADLAKNGPYESGREG